jgi:hypothetical protein
MSSSARMIVVWAGLVVLVGALAIVLFMGGATRPPWTPPTQWVTKPGAIPVGILGDSDSTSYQGRVGRTQNDGPWGSALHASVLQWPEVLARMRGDAVNLGEWAEWGVPRWLSMTRLRDGLGLRWRNPQKIDYRHNMAVWGSDCRTLLYSPWRQAPRLIDIMDESPADWARGVVIIRIGVNDFGKESLFELAKNPKAARPVTVIQQCIEDIRQTVNLIHARNAQTRIVLVGIFNNAHWAPLIGEFQSPLELRNIDIGLDIFDNSLRQMALSDPRVAFFDDRAWFKRLWGGRNAEGMPAYRTIEIAGLAVSNSSGDMLEHATLTNGHNGLVWNTLWTQELVELLRHHFGLPIEGISDTEVEKFIAERLPP